MRLSHYTLWVALLAISLLAGCTPFMREAQAFALRRATRLSEPQTAATATLAPDPPSLAATVVAPRGTLPEPPTAAPTGQPPITRSDALSHEQADAILDVAEALTIRVYEQVGPSVVNITTRALQMGFYGVYPSEGSGSGFFIDRDGHIVTNYHVIEGAQSVEVTLIDQTVVTAEIVGTDAFSDLAVLKVAIDPSEIVPVDTSFDGEIKVGMRAIAIGNPFGLDWTLTSGVVSSVGRPLQLSEQRTIYDVIQTDAAINPGNSGGPLLNSRGQLIGVNTAIRSGAENIGFAIPLATLQRIVPELITRGHYGRPWLGLVGYRLSPELARRLSLPVDKGLLIAQVYGDSPAALVGLRGGNQEARLGNVRLFIGGDILVALDGTAIESNAELTQFLETRTRVGQEVEVSYYRGDRLQSARLVLTEQPS